MSFIFQSEIVLWSWLFVRSHHRKPESRSFLWETQFLGFLESFQLNILLTERTKRIIHDSTRRSNLQRTQSVLLLVHVKVISEWKKRYYCCKLFPLKHSSLDLYALYSCIPTLPTRKHGLTFFVYQHVNQTFIPWKSLSVLQRDIQNLKLLRT